MPILNSRFQYSCVLAPQAGSASDRTGSMTFSLQSAHAARTFSASVTHRLASKDLLKSAAAIFLFELVLC